MAEITVKDEKGKELSKLTLVRIFRVIVCTDPREVMLMFDGHNRWTANLEQLVHRTIELKESGPVRLFWNDGLWHMEPGKPAEFLLADGSSLAIEMTACEKLEDKYNVVIQLTPVKK